MSRTKISRAVDAAAVLAVFAGATAAFAVAGRGGVTVAGVAGGVEHRAQMHRADVNMPRPGVCVVERGGRVLVLDGCTVSAGRDSDSGRP
jgi:hypothetical protein